MSSLQSPLRTTLPQHLAEQLRNPTEAAIWDRAKEVFADPEEAKSWIFTERAVFEGLSPVDIVAGGEIPRLRQVLEELIRIDYGVFS